MCVCGQNCFYCFGNKIIKIFAFGWALLSALEPYAACAAAVSGQTIRLNGFGLCQYDLARVHIMTRDMQRAHMQFFFLDLFLLASSSKGFADWFDPLLCADLAY